MLKKSYEFNLPHFNERPKEAIIDTIVIHYTEKIDDTSWYKAALEIGVSSHYLINKQGKIYSVVPDNFRAWHAGESFWRGRKKINDCSIGIELDNNGQEAFSKNLMASLIELCHELILNHPIDPFNIIGHADIAPGRKSDPGKLFDWRLLAQNSIGIMPKNLLQTTIPDIKVVQSMLAEYGYKIDITGIKDQKTLDVMHAFNEHFNQQCSKNWDLNSQMMLEALLRLNQER